MSVDIGRVVWVSRLTVLTGVVGAVVVTAAGVALAALARAANRVRDDLGGPYPHHYWGEPMDLEPEPGTKDVAGAADGPADAQPELSAQLHLVHPRSPVEQIPLPLISGLGPDQHDRPS